MDANYAYYALHKLKILPSIWVDMDDNERAFCMAAIDIKIQNEKKQAAEMKHKKR